MVIREKNLRDKKGRINLTAIKADRPQEVEDPR